MKNLKTISLLTLSAFACCSVVFAQSGPAKAIKAYYAKDDALMLKLDFVGLKKLKTEYSTSDYVSFNKPDKAGNVKKSTLAQEFQEMDQFRGIIDTISRSATHVDRMTIQKTTTVVMVTSSGEVKTKKLPKDGKVHSIANTSVSQDTWVLAGRSWKMKSSKTLSDKLVVDGRPIPGM